MHIISGMGDYDYLCDVEVDYCYSNPCNSSGECERTEGGYTCRCHQGFAGRYCMGVGWCEWDGGIRRGKGAWGRV